MLYIGQAEGSAISGFLYARDLLYAAGYVASAFVALALVTMILTNSVAVVQNTRSAQTPA